MASNLHQPFLLRVLCIALVLISGLGTGWSVPDLRCGDVTHSCDQAACVKSCANSGAAWGSCYRLLPTVFKCCCMHYHQKIIP
ncbi:hypothetical protein VNO77_19447 [Canavalia gladiata]|uniref:LCR n=1 Tax=Canavalia gladiata TaxID=3824 RepID=A0AAN9LMH0_CANGL